MVLEAYHPLFTEDILTASQTAARERIDNSIPRALQPNARRLSAFLGEVNAGCLGTYQRGLVVSSGYRCPKLNAAVGGAADSDHMRALAADTNVPTIRPFDLAIYLESVLSAYRVEWAQMIIEFGSWVHLSLPQEGQKGKRELLTALRRPNTQGQMRTIYMPGLKDMK